MLSVAGRMAKCVPPMLRPMDSPSAAATLRPLQMLTGVVFGGAVMVCAARIAMDAAAPMPSVLAIAVVVLALVGAAVAITMFGYAVPSLPAGLPRENAEATSLRYFSQTTVVRAVLCEVPVLVAFGASLAFSPHSWLPIVIALPGSAALFYLHAWPSPRTAAAVERGLEADGAPSWLSEALGFR